MTTLKRMVRSAGAVTWLIGIVTCIGLTIWSGPDAVGHAVANVGWGIPLVLAIRAVTISISGLGWWLVFPLHIRPRLATCILLSLVREAGNLLLPLGQVGGDLIGAALLTSRGIAGPLASAILGRAGTGKNGAKGHQGRVHQLITGVRAATVRLVPTFIEL